MVIALGESMNIKNDLVKPCLIGLSLASSLALVIILIIALCFGSYLVYEHNIFILVSEIILVSVGVVVNVVTLGRKLKDVKKN